MNFDTPLACFVDALDRLEDRTGNCWGIGPKMMADGARFLVARRAESKSFRTLANVNISAGFTPMFSEIPETEFRRDISSTELRAGESRQRDRYG